MERVSKQRILVRLWTVEELNISLGSRKLTHHATHVLVFVLLGMGGGGGCHWWIGRYWLVFVVCGKTGPMIDLPR